MQGRHPSPINIVAGEGLPINRWSLSMVASRSMRTSVSGNGGRTKNNSTDPYSPRTIVSPRETCTSGMSLSSTRTRTRLAVGSTSESGADRMCSIRIIISPSTH
eukprot:1188544-Prorocentrum_minimum.AAC.1